MTDEKENAVYKGGGADGAVLPFFRGGENTGSVKTLI